MRSAGVAVKIATLASQLLGAAGKRRWRIGTAESVTGGMVGAAVTSVPGASAWYVGGFIVYTNTAKADMLGISERLLATHGAVSAEAARAMADGCRKRLGVQIVVVTTGIAGPASDESGTPVGTVFVACATDDDSTTEQLMLHGSRAHIRVQATRAALALAVRMVQGG